MKRALLLLMLVVLTPAVASAGYITESWSSLVRTDITVGARVVQTYTGYVTLNVTDATGMAPLSTGTYEAYCVDLMHWSGNNTAESGSMLAWTMAGPTGSGLTYPLYTGARNAASYLPNTYVGQAGTDRVALQAAIWEVLFETGASYGLYSGGVSFNFFGNTASWETAHLAAFNTFVSEAANNLNYQSDATWIKVGNPAGDPYNGYYQDFATKVPEPGSMMLVGVGLVGLAAAVRRRKK